MPANPPVVLKAAVTAACLLGLLAAPASGAVNARLAGTFDTVGTVTAGDGPPPPGTKVQRVYRFTPLCKSGTCAKVRIARQTSSGSFVKTVLTRVAAGTYTGTEVQPDPRCANGAYADSRRGKLRVEILAKDSKGLATKMRGTVKFTIKGCPETFQNGKFSGRRR